MTLFSYEIFDAVARQGSFNKAAQQLHLTPAMQLTLEWHANADARFSVLLRALKEIFFEAARSGQYLYAVSYTHLTLPTTPYV